MPDYRRYRIAGGCYFFTVNLLERSPNDLLVRHIDLLRQAVRRVKQVRSFRIDAFVVLPDHLRRGVAGEHSVQYAALLHPTLA